MLPLPATDYAQFFPWSIQVRSAPSEREGTVLWYPLLSRKINSRREGHVAFRSLGVCYACSRANLEFHSPCAVCRVHFRIVRFAEPEIGLSHPLHRVSLPVSLHPDLVLLSRSVSSEPSATASPYGWRMSHP